MNDDRDNPSPDGFIAVPPDDPPRTPLDTPWSKPLLLGDVLAPMWASLRVERGAPADGARRVLVTLTADALWLQDRGAPLPRTRRVRARLLGRGPALGEAVTDAAPSRK